MNRSFCDNLRLFLLGPDRKNSRELALFLLCNEVILIDPGDSKQRPLHGATLVAWMPFNSVPLWNKRTAWVTPGKSLSRTNFLA